MIRGEQKVTGAHLERAAVVYVRQLTLVQVREHTESTLRQYDLAGQAARLGWPGSAIEVIDEDLGLSGRTASGRDGFKRLVARVCLGEVGAVFGLEVSRLAHMLKARHGWNWGQLRRHLTAATGRWHIAADGAEFFRIEQVTVSRHTYHGNEIPSPWPPANPA